MNKNILILFTLCALCSVQAKETKSMMLPRYKLPVGKKLCYSSNSEFKGSNFSSGSNTQTQFWAVNKNPDQSYRLIINRTATGYRVYGDTLRKEEEADITWSYCDIFPDGKIVQNASLEVFDPSTIFIPIPDDTLVIRQGWENFNPDNQERNKYKLENKNLTDSSWSVEIVNETPLDIIYELSSSSFVYIDVRKGLPVRKESEFIRGFGYSAGKTTTTTTLDSIQPLDTVRIKNFVQELTSLFHTDSIYNALMDMAEPSVPNKNKFIKNAESVLNEAMKNTTDSTIKSLLNEKISYHQQIISSISDDFAWFAMTIGKRAEGWKLEDLNGKTHTLKQNRGKVIVLDFWYRGCPWCIRAMPMINQIAEYFKDLPVVVFGMNVDKNKDDALFVADKLRLVYPSLQASGVDGQYSVTGFPTLFIVDQKGIIRDIHIGYSPDLGVKVTKKIESLLEKK